MSHKPRIELRRFAVFSVVGTLNTAICYALFAALVEWAHWHYNAALVADYAFGILLGYVLHCFSTFADLQQGRQAFGKYTLTLIATFTLNAVLLDAIVERQWLDPLAAQAVAMSAVTLGSYLLQRHWVFRVQAAEDGVPAESTHRNAA